MATAVRSRPKLSVSRPMDLDRALPSDEAMEAALLGTIIMDAPFALAEIRLTTPNLAARHFYKLLHQKIFAGILELEEAGQAIDLLSVESWLRDHSVADALSVVGELSANVPIPAHPATYAQRIYDLARQRAQIQTAYKMFMAAWAGNNEEYNELTEKTARLREDFVPAKQRKLKYRSLRDIVATEYPEQRMLVEKLIQQGVVTILAGKAKAGKSFWLLAAAIAVAEACQSAFQNIDEDGEVLYHGLHCQQSRVLYMALEDTERRIKNRVTKMRGELPIPEYIDVATEAPRIDEGVIEQMEAYLDEHPDCRMIIIDTLTSVLPLPTNGGGYLEDRLNMQGLRDLAHRRDVAILPVLHCRKADGSDVFDTIQTTMGTQAGTENMIVLQRRRGEDRAILHVTGNDIESEALALKWNKENFTWSILGDAETVAETEQEELIFGAIEAVESEGKPAKLAAISAHLKGEMAFSQVRTLLYRMSTVKPNSPVKNKLVNNGGVFSRNTTIKSENVENRENIENIEKPENLFDEAAITMADEAFSDSHHFHTSQHSQHSQKLIESENVSPEGIINASLLIDASSMAHVEEVVRQEVAAEWERREWKPIQINPAAKAGGNANTARAYLKSITGLAGLAALMTAVLALGGA